MLLQLNSFRIYTSFIFYEIIAMLKSTYLNSPFATGLERRAKSLCWDGEGQGSASLARSTFPSMR